MGKGREPTSTWAAEQRARRRSAAEARARRERIEAANAAHGSGRTTTTTTTTTTAGPPPPVSVAAPAVSTGASLGPLVPRRWHRPLVFGVLGLLVAGLIVAGVLLVPRGGGGDSGQGGLSIPVATSTGPSSSESSPRVSTTGVSSSVPAPPAKMTVSCVEESSPKRTVSSRSGGTGSAESVIVAFEHRFFVERDPAAMLALTNRSPNVSDEGSLQAGLGVVPVGTSWCVEIEPRGNDMFGVTIRFVGKFNRVVTWRQDMTVARRGSRYVITNVVAQ